MENNQDIFSFFNCFFFWDETISLLSFYSCPDVTAAYNVAKTDWFLFAYNRNFPITFSNFKKAQELVEKHGWKNIVLLENTFEAHDISLVTDRLSDEGFQDALKQTRLFEGLSSDRASLSLFSILLVPHLKVKTCSNEVINEVFYTIISSAQTKKGLNIEDPKGALIGEKELSKTTKQQPVADVGMQHIDDINGIEAEKKKCTIF